MQACCGFHVLKQEEVNLQGNFGCSFNCSGISALKAAGDRSNNLEEKISHEI
jgi:hypothetical protein